MCLTLDIMWRLIAAINRCRDHSMGDLKIIMTVMRVVIMAPLIITLAAARNGWYNTTPTGWTDRLSTLRSVIADALLRACAYTFNLRTHRVTASMISHPRALNQLV